MRRFLAIFVVTVVSIWATSAFAAPKKLVCYFSATGRTRAVAEQIARETGAELFEIVPQRPYTSQDLDYRAKDSRCVKEHNDRSMRPAIAKKCDKLKDADIVFVGYPIWWGEAPNIILTFFETNDLAGKRIIPFCTSHSSPLGGSDLKLHPLERNAKWQTGACFDFSATGGDVTRWLKTLWLDK